MRGYHVALLILAYAVVCTTSDRMTELMFVASVSEIFFSKITQMLMKSNRKQSQKERMKEKKVYKRMQKKYARRNHTMCINFFLDMYYYAILII